MIIYITVAFVIAVGVSFTILDMKLNVPLDKKYIRVWYNAKQLIRIEHNFIKTTVYLMNEYNADNPPALYKASKEYRDVVKRVDKAERPHLEFLKEHIDGLYITENMLRTIEVSLDSRK